MKKAWVFSYPLSAQRRLWSDWADAQADLSLRWAHTYFVGFVMLWLIFVWLQTNQLFINELFSFYIPLLFSFDQIWYTSQSTIKQTKSTCVPSEDSDQPWQPPSLIRGFALSFYAWVAKDPNLVMPTTKNLIGLDRCPGWSESLLGIQVIFCLLCLALFCLYINKMYCNTEILIIKICHLIQYLYINHVNEQLQICTISQTKSLFHC